MFPNSEIPAPGQGQYQGQGRCQPQSQGQNHNPGQIQGHRHPHPPLLSSMSTSGPSSSSQEDSRKRPRYSVSKVKSCAECRRLKLKCDRKVPCNNCIRRGTNTICPQGVLKTAKGRTMILESNEVLHGRIAQLESALHDLSSSNGGHPLLDQAYHLDSSENGSSPGPEEVVDMPPEPAKKRAAGTNEVRIPEVSAPAPHTEPSYTEPEAITGSGSTSDVHPGHLRFDTGDPRASRFYGDASSLFFVEGHADPSNINQQVSNAPLFRPGWVEAFMFERDSAIQLQRSLGQLINQLPKREEAERLASSYFENVAWGTNILDQRVFNADVMERFYGDAGPPDIQRLGVLFLTLAVGALFDLSMQPGALNNPYSRDLFALGRACLSLDSTASIIFVQACHLACNWLINGGGAVNANQATWTILGVAMRGVQMLGLHRDGKLFDLSADEIAERRRVFWEVHSYDVTQAIMTGRPRAMTRSAFDVEIPVTEPGGDEYHAARYTLMDRCFSRINDEQVKITPSSYETVVQLDREIRKFQQDLPSQLTVDDRPAPGRRATQRTHDVQKHTIRFQYTLALLFLHRTWFAKALLDIPEEPLRSKYSPSYIGCLEACKLLLEVVRRLNRDAFELCARRWFFLFHSFTACACLAASVIRAPLSMLAQSSLLALEDGLKLFERANKQDELIMLSRLCDTAKKCFNQAGRTEPTTEEDLAMLGKGRKKASSAGLSPHANTTRPNVLAGPNSFQAMAYGRQPAAEPLRSTHTSHQISQVQIPNIVPFHDHLTPAPSSHDVEQDYRDPGMAQEGGGGDFDFDAFLANFGLASDITDLFGDLGDSSRTF